MNFTDILKHDDKFRYQLLSRMKGDCDYYLGNGNRYAGCLWGQDEVHHIAYMKALWNSFGENDKPEWLSFEQILEYEQKIGKKAILVEMDYKGYYERFALTPEEFEKEFPETYKHFGPFEGVVNTLGKGGELSSFEYSDSDTLRPMVHIWFCPTNIGSDLWETFFTDMEWGLPESDIESGNLAYIDYNQMQSLSKYLSAEDTQIKVGDLRVFNTHGIDSELNSRSGQIVEVLRLLTDNEVDVDDVGPMFRVRFSDGYEIDAFKDELEIKVLENNISLDEKISAAKREGVNRDSSDTKEKDFESER